MALNKQKNILLILIIVLIFLAPICLNSADAVGKRSLTHNDYDLWKSITRSHISSDGTWILYIETPQDGEAELVVKSLSKTGVEFRHTVGYSGEGTDAERAASPQFSHDISSVLFLISPSQQETKEAKKDKKKDKPKKRLGIMALNSGEITILEKVESFQIPEKSGGWVSYLKEKEEEEEKKKEAEKKELEKEDDKKKEKEKTFGTSLMLRSLTDGKETTFKSVLSYQFTKNGSFLYYVVSSKDEPETDGLYVFRPGEEDSSALLTGKGNYKGLALDKEQTKLAFFTDRDDHVSDEPTFNLYGCAVGASKADLLISHSSTPGFPEGMSVSDKSKISFSEDGSVMMFGIKEIPEPKKEDEKEEKAKFDLWHWNDPYPQPQQKIMASRVKNNTWETVYHFKSKKMVKLADEDIPDVELSRNGKICYAQTIQPYTKKIAYDGSYYDIYVIDPVTGTRTLVKKELFRKAALSPNGKYVYWFEENNWHVYDIARKAETNITGSLNIRFDREDWDTPAPAYAYGVAGWTDDDKTVLLYEKYDIWEIAPDGSNPRKITEEFGRNNDLSFRYIRTDPDKRTIDPEKPMLLRAFNEETMDGGFYQDKASGKKPPEKLIMASKNFSFLTKAKKADVFVFTRSSFDEYPDILVSDRSFKNIRKVTNLGEQMEPFLWGQAELRNFFSSDGKPIKGILIKPKDFNPNKKYPLLVYIYETLHQWINRYRNPSPGTSINPAFYVSNGYIVWMPDIEYDTGYPGKDAMKCVLPGIQMLVREGFIDPEAIGIQGHSWGGYQIAYMITQTNIFAAAEAGAPVSNMISAYGGIRWGSGLVRQFQYEKTQSRLGASLWEVPMRYIENSPIFWVDKVRTPVMMIHNDKDGAVPWYQGIEFMMALRRLGKEAYMFNYNGEAHGLRKRVNQMDWTKRMFEFFEHHLRGVPAPDWMTKGIRAWDKETNVEKDL